MTIETLGVEIAKNLFQLHGVNENGRAVPPSGRAPAHAHEPRRNEALGDARRVAEGRGSRTLGLRRVDRCWRVKAQARRSL
jgi:hypothetical protein